MVSQWYAANVQLLRSIYGKVNYNDDNFSWIDIKRFILPPVYYQTTTRLFMLTPGIHLDNYKAFDFYVDQGLFRPDVRSFEHIFEHDGYNLLADRGLARLSLHLKSFQPSPDVYSGDKLLDIVQNVYNFLALREGL